jgi:hypothetical protein
MVRRRRPLLRAAMLGGVGFASYQAGRRADLYALPRDASVAPREASLSRQQALAMLQHLLDAHVLTEAEFDAARRRVPPS